MEVCWATNLLPGTGSLTERDSDLCRPAAEHHLEKFMKNKNNKEIYLSSRGRRQFLRRGAGSMAGAWLSAWPWHELMAQQDLNPIEENLSLIHI